MGGGQRPSVSWWPRFAQRGAHSTSCLLGQLGRQRGHVPSTTQGCRCFCCRGAHRSSHTCSPFARGSRQRIPSFSGFRDSRVGSADGFRPRQPAFHDIEPGVPTHGWQFFVARAIEEHFVSSSIVPRLSPTDSALAFSVRSHGGPPVLRGAFLLVCSVLPSALPCSPPSSLMASPLSSRTCRCGRPLDIFGHHRAACSRAGILGSRGFALESAAARVCREGGGRVATTLFLRDLDVPVPVTDSRRLEVVCDGLPLFRGAQLALDTTLVSPVCSNGEPRGRSAVEDGAVLSSALTEGSHLPGPHSRARLVVLAADTEAVGQKRHTVSCPSWPKQRRGQFPTSCVVALARLGSTGGRRCSLVRLPLHSPCPCWTVVPLVVLTGQLYHRPWFSPRAAICRWGLRREVVL